MRNVSQKHLRNSLPIFEFVLDYGVVFNSILDPDDALINAFPCINGLTQSPRQQPL